MKVYSPLVALEKMGGIDKAKEKFALLLGIPESEIEIDVW